MYFPDFKKYYFYTVSSGKQTQWESALLKQWVNRLLHQLCMQCPHRPGRKWAPTREVSSSQSLVKQWTLHPQDTTAANSMNFLWFKRCQRKLWWSGPAGAIRCHILDATTRQCAFILDS